MHDIFLLWVAFSCICTVSVALTAYDSLPAAPRSEEWYQYAAEQLSPYFSTAEPIRYIVVDDFFPDELSRAVANSFPSYTKGFNGTMEGEFWMTAINAQFLKVQQPAAAIDPTVQFLIDHMRSSSFVLFLERLSGIRGLLPDPHLYGAGMHHTLSGGHLGVHLDYNFNDALVMWRRLNVFLYLNEDWQDEWNGHLEFYNEDLDTALLSIAPLFNRLVVFEASEFSWHGHPDPLRCPPDRVRKSIAMYYYTVQDNPAWTREPRATQFMPRKHKDTWTAAEWSHAPQPTPPA